MSADSVASPAFTILLPVHRPPSMLPYAIRSVLGQTRPDFELFVICDGAPPETVACARELAAQDERIRVFVHPKGERHGELYRDQALRSARGRYVCQIADDDLWFPNHLEEMAILLGQAEFGNLLQVIVARDGKMTCLLGDLARIKVRRTMLTQRWNFFGPTVAGYRLETYRRLPMGWSPAPLDLWTDLHMWRKFLSLPGIVCATRFNITSLHQAAYLRTAMSDGERAEENRRLLAEIQDPARRDAIVQTVLRRIVRRAEITRRTMRHLARARGSAELEADPQENEAQVLAEIQLMEGELALEQARRLESWQPPHNPRGLQRLLRWVTGTT